MLRNPAEFVATAKENGDPLFIKVGNVLENQFLRTTFGFLFIVKRVVEKCTELMFLHKTERQYSCKETEQELIMEKIAMRGVITKYKDVWKRLLQPKGQGLTEFVLVLAFCAIIGWAASKVGFLDAIGAAFDVSKKPEYITAAIGGGGSPGGNPGGDTPGGDDTDGRKTGGDDEEGGKKTGGDDEEGGRKTAGDDETPNTGAGAAGLASLLLVAGAAIVLGKRKKS